MQADILRHYDFMQQVFEHLEEDSSGPTMTRGQLELTARLAAAVGLDSEGRLVEMPLVAKDITRESFMGGALTSYRGTHAGHGPRYEGWLRQRAFETKLHAMSTFEEGAARLFGPFTDLWCIILVHKDWVIIIVIVLLSRSLLLFRKHNVPLPLFLVHSSKVTNIFISGLMKKCWRPDLSKHDFEAFMNDPTLDTFRAVLPGNLPSFRTDDLKHLASELGMEKWEKLRLANFSKYAGDLAIVHIGPLTKIKV